MSEVKDNTWLDKIKDLLGDTPKDKKDLITLLDTAAKNSLITQDIFQMNSTACRPANTPGPILVMT